MSSLITQNPIIDNDDDVDPVPAFIGQVRNLVEIAALKELLAQAANVPADVIMVPVYGGLTPFPDPRLDHTTEVPWSQHPVYNLPAEVLENKNKESEQGWIIRIALELDIRAALDADFMWIRNAKLAAPRINPDIIALAAATLATAPGSASQAVEYCDNHHYLSSETGERSFYNSSAAAAPQWKAIESGVSEYIDNAIDTISDISAPKVQAVDSITLALDRMDRIRQECDILAMTMPGEILTDAQAQTLIQTILMVSDSEEKSVDIRKQLTKAVENLDSDTVDNIAREAYLDYEDSWMLLRQEYVQSVIRRKFRSYEEMDLMISALRESTKNAATDNLLAAVESDFGIAYGESSRYEKDFLGSLEESRTPRQRNTEEPSLVDNFPDQPSKKEEKSQEVRELEELLGDM